MKRQPQFPTSHRWSTILSTILLSSSLTSSLQSCTTVEFNEFVPEDSSDPVEVTVSLTSIDFTVKPAHVPGAPASGITRASDATPTQAGLTRISLKVFNKEGESVADTSQIATVVGEGFNNLKIQLPAGTYTFVAVAHDTSADNIGCATIESPEVVTLPEGIIPTLYAHVQQVTIANANNQSVPIDMGKRINATLRLASTDIVPEGIRQMAVDLNPGGVKIGANNLPRFNPSTGTSIEHFRFSRALPVTAGAPIDVSMNLLLTADEYSFPTKIYAQDASNEFINDYTRSFTSVPFQRAYVTTASGQYFRYVNTSSMTFDITNGTLDYSF